MKKTSLLVRLRSRCFPWWRALPIFGPLLDEFVQWMHEAQHYTLGSVSVYLNVVPRIVRWLRLRQIRALPDLTLQDLKAAHRHFRPRHAATSGAVCVLERFLRARGTTPDGESSVPSPAEVEIDQFATYLRETRGLAPATIRNHRREVRAFLRFIRFDRSPSRLQQLKSGDIEAFLCQSARTNSRASLQHVVATIRALHTSDLRLTAPASVLLRGKGQKERTCPIWPETANLLQRLMDQRGLPPTQSAPLFLNDRGTRLTRFGVRLILKKYVEKAAQRLSSLKQKRLHPHSVRHSTAIHLLRSGVDISTIAHWLGHGHVNTANKYLSIGLDAKREALAKAAPLLKGALHSGKWRKNPDLIAWLQAL